MKEEQILEDAEMKDHPQVKEEQEDHCINPNVEADASNCAEVKLLKSEPTSGCELFPSSSSVSVNVTETLDKKQIETEGPSSPPHSHSIEVIVDMEQPSRDEKKCRFCGKHFRKDSFLIRHVEKSHKGKKAFKCLKCSKEFDARPNLVVHTRIHTGEKPFKCDFCDRTFVQNSSRIVHMRVHTGEKPYFCKNCGKSFAISKHLKFCKKQNNSCQSPPVNVTTQEDMKVEKRFKCFGCQKEFQYKYQFEQHSRVHTGEKPFRCEVCGKTFTQSSSRNVHMRLHTGEKPYFCTKCGQSVTHQAHLIYCTGTQNKRKKKSFRCEMCGKTFFTNSELKVHFEVHEQWKRYISEKQEPEIEEKKPMDK
ncbi:zinc finger protein 239-like [Cheilinus undulatus]|uniref:zinc finger protein 239-like n=1 Tax=Cheilinus undulatus TaxID=241271 RepID=UPI001BD31616|nr:zinc finger protein 239-like [Cheilinus undulatus]